MYASLNRAPAVVLILALVWPGTLRAEPDEQTRATMRRVFDTLAELLPLSFDDAAFASPERRNEILQKLEQLSKSTRDLEGHSGDRDAGFRFRSRSLARDVTEIRRRYEYGHFAEAQFYVAQLTEHCVGCHSRLPSARDFPFSERLLSQPTIREMEPRDLARLHVATRRFDSALDFWEARLGDPSVSPAEMDLDEELVDYLTVAVRVKRDLPRARKTLARLAERKDLPRYLRYQTSVWQRSLKELDGQKLVPGIARARELIERARGLSEFPADRAGLIYDLVASSLLYQRVDEAGVPLDEIAEAFYRLGGIEARSSGSSWVSAAEFHLEASIRLAPKSAYAEKAYALLEEYTVVGYGGSSGVHLPPEVEKKLEELRVLLDATGS